MTSPGVWHWLAAEDVRSTTMCLIRRPTSAILRHIVGLPLKPVDSRQRAEETDQVTSRQASACLPNYGPLRLVA